MAEIPVQWLGSRIADLAAMRIREGLPIEDTPEVQLFRSLIESVSAGDVPKELAQEKLESAFSRFKPTPPDRFGEGVTGQQKVRIGDLYQLLIPQESRRGIGQFWTPVEVSDFMVQWAIQSPETRFLDPAAGAGVFIESAWKRLIELGATKSQAMEGLAGFEISPTVGLIGRIALEAEEPGLGMTLIPGDYLSMPRPFVPKAIVCNPPYTRHHLLTDFHKVEIRGQLQTTLGIEVGRKASLFLYFFLWSASELAERGRLAYITPTELYEARYSRGLRALFRDKLRLIAVLRFSPGVEIFPGVDVAPCITLAEKDRGHAAEEFKLIEVSSLAALPALEEELDGLTAGTYEWGKVSCRRIDEIGNPRSAISLTRTEPPRGWTKLGDYARTMRGVATGANKFFLLNRSDIQSYGIESVVTSRVVARTRDVQGFVVTDEVLEAVEAQGRPTYLLTLLPEHRIDEFPGAMSYLEVGKLLRVPERTLVAQRQAWYHMERREPAEIYFTYLARKRPRFMLNKCGAQALTTFLYVYPDRRIFRTDEDLNALLAVLNSERFLSLLKEFGKSYGWSSVKIEPRMLEQVPFPDFRGVSPRRRLELAGLFEMLAQASSLGEERETRMIIDQVLDEIALKELDERAGWHQTTFSFG